MRRIVAFDLETTGLDEERDRVVEFCFLTLDDDLKVTGRWCERVDPGVPIPTEASAVHGITAADVDGLPPFSHYAPRIQSLVKDSLLVVYNHQFDVPFLHHELVRAHQAGIRPDHPVVDPYQIFRQYRPHSLEHAVHDYLHRDHDGAHGALADTLATVEVLGAQVAAHDLPRDLRLLAVDVEKQWLDYSRKVYRDAQGVARFAFGKHNGEPVVDHLDYVDWVQASQFPDDTKRVLARLAAAAERPTTTRVPGADAAERA